MSRNIWQDNRPLTAAVLNSLASAIGGVSTISGCTPTVGTGTWDVDVASGTVRVDGTGDVSVSAQTVDLNDPTSDLNSGESRVVLVTIDNTGGASATEGAAATDPATPDIPDSEVVVAVVYVTAADADLSEADLYDIRTLFGDGANSGLNADLLQGDPPSAFRDTVYGDGSDGTITESANTTISDRVWSESYTVDDGVTVTASTDVVLIHARDFIEINGVVNATGLGASGGAGGAGGSDANDAGDDGDPGSQATAGDIKGANGTGGGGGSGGSSGNGDSANVTSGSDGGDGTTFAAGGGGGGGSGQLSGTGTGGSGGSGADGATRSTSTLTDTELDMLRQWLTGPWDEVYKIGVLAGSGGGGGGGGGEGDDGAAGGDGGTGGDGGGVVILAAPEIRGDGEIKANGTDGSTGADGGDGSQNAGAGGGGGGGGGGNGGFIATVAPTVSSSVTLTAAGGAGGAGGTGGTQDFSTGGDGGAGSAGDGGTIIRFDQ